MILKISVREMELTRHLDIWPEQLYAIFHIRKTWGENVIWILHFFLCEIYIDILEDTESGAQKRDLAILRVIGIYIWQRPNNFSEREIRLKIEKALQWNAGAKKEHTLMPQIKKRLKKKDDHKWRGKIGVIREYKGTESWEERLVYSGRYSQYVK